MAQVVQKPRFAVLLEDLHNATNVTLPGVSYGLEDDKDPEMNTWRGTFFLSNGTLAIEFGVTCGKKYPDEAPILTFRDNVKVNDKIKLDNTRKVLPESEICQRWLKYDHNQRNLDRFLELVKLAIRN